MSLLTYIYKYNNSHYILFETSYSKPCQLIQPERDPETKRQNEKIVEHKQEAKRLNRITSSVCWDKFDKILHEWFDTKIRKQFIWKRLFVELFLLLSPLYKRGDRLTCVTNGFGRSLFINMKIDKRKTSDFPHITFPKICLLK